jgi:GNAT superfamily N-acetyltransferase
MKRVRDSAFNHRALTVRGRLSRRRRHLGEPGRHPVALTRHRCWIVRAEVGDDLVGYAWGYLPSENDTWAYVDDVAVLVEHQGRGVGGLIIDEMVSWFGECGIVRVAGLATDPRMERIFLRHHIKS